MRDISGETELLIQIERKAVAATATTRGIPLAFSVDLQYVIPLKKESKHIAHIVHEKPNHSGKRRFFNNTKSAVTVISITNPKIKLNLFLHIFFITFHVCFK